MQSEVVLGNVIEALNLNDEWGKKYYNGETLKTNDTMELLKQRMSLSPIRNTKLIDITVYSEDKNDAAQAGQRASPRRIRITASNCAQQLTSKASRSWKTQFQEEEDANSGRPDQRGQTAQGH